MRAHHYVSALEAGRAAGRDSPELVDATRLALREAGDRASALNAVQAAVHHYDRALELSREDDDDRPELLFTAARARFDAAEGDVEELTAARDALLATGDTARAAEAAVLAGDAAWTEGRGEDALRLLERAEELAEPLPTSAAKASVYATLSRLHWLGSRDEKSRRLSSEALAMADELGLVAIRAQLLTRLGTSRAVEGDLSGLDALEESIAIYEQLGSPDAQRPYNNLADTLYRLGRIHAGRRGDGPDERGAKALSGHRRMGPLEREPGAPRPLRGRQLGAGARASRAPDRSVGASGTRHYLESDWRIVRARIRFARGDTAGARGGCGDRARTGARRRRRAAHDSQPRAAGQTARGGRPAGNGECRSRAPRALPPNAR